MEDMVVTKAIPVETRRSKAKEGSGEAGTGRQRLKGRAGWGRLSAGEGRE